MLSKLAVRRLTTLIKFMKALPPSANKHFDMGDFLYHSGDHDHSHKFSRKVTKGEILHNCGTKACALGWAATVPAFKKAGLAIDEEGDVTLGNLCIHYSNFSVAQKFFDIKISDVHYLFGGHTDTVKTPKQWAKCAEQFLKENRAS